MSRGKDPVHPHQVVTRYAGGYPEPSTEEVRGITLREYYAGLAMQGWLANKARPQSFHPTYDMAYCVAVADSLIAALAQDGEIAV